MGSNPTSGTADLNRYMASTALLPDRVFDSVTGVMLDNHVVTIDGDRVISVEPALEDIEAEQQTLYTFPLGFALGKITDFTIAQLALINYDVVGFRS